MRAVSKRKAMSLTSEFNQLRHLLRRENRFRLALSAALFFVVLLLVTPRVPHSPSLHLFADMRTLLAGVPNTLNVLTTYPLLLFGVPGLVLCIFGGWFGISLRGEAVVWAFYFAGNAIAGFGSAYYHLKPDDDRIVWDRLPMMISSFSLLSLLVIERVNERLGLSCLFSFLTLAFVSIACERVFDDLRLCMLLHLLPCIAIPTMVYLLPPKYTFSRFWFLATGFYLLARFEGLADRKVYNANGYFISGHSLEHLCLSMVSFILTLMLSFRSIRIARDS
ncbi:Alkaline phytoceramidase (APHC) [Rhynchospora pubera]|uniref:Alkaline phytoceramidase (APHC) n=1 Tax=Rhynchospora pubera TaxID=906938 RepID=A0AAV8DFY7_9POAL|nr:Alkaline phytoceramidase (APHC) [Rhynchospora pubera]